MQIDQNNYKENAVSFVKKYLLTHLLVLVVIIQLIVIFLSKRTNAKELGEVYTPNSFPEIQDYSLLSTSLFPTDYQIPIDSVEDQTLSKEISKNTMHPSPKENNSESKDTTKSPNAKITSAPTKPSTSPKPTS